MRPAAPADIAAMREARRRSTALAIMPGFYSRLVDEARPFLILEVTPGAGAGPGPGAGAAGEGRAGEGDAPAGDASGRLGYVLLLERPHGGHSHITLIEMYLEPTQAHRYEDALDLVAAQQGPTAYLVRTDDCLLSAGLLARGLQAEPTALVMLPGDMGPTETPDGEGLGLEALTSDHLPALERLLAGSESAGGPWEELSVIAEAGRGWVLTRDGDPVAVLARLGEDRGEYELLDFAVGHAPEADLAWGLAAATAAVRDRGRRPAAVIDALEIVRRRVFRRAGYHTAAAYVVFYDPHAGRPSIGVLGLEELRAMMERGDQFRLLDVMGAEHWKDGHLPGAEWIDFRGLAKEARRRYRPDETIVVYCNGFT